MNDSLNDAASSALTTSWHSYPSSYNLGHKAIQLLLSVPVVVEEKVDGSQFSFGVFPPGPNDTCFVEGSGLAIRIRSKGAVMNADAPEKMFSLGAETVKELAKADLLHIGWTYRSEYLRSPKHNSLAYDRIPKGHIILFDINTGDQEFLSYDQKVAEANRLGLEVVPRLFEGKIENIEAFRQFLDTTSILGGQKIEGVVIKPVGYCLFGVDRKALLGKFVSEAFKEVHSKAWKESNPSNADIIAILAAQYTTPARWGKAVQHLREAGLIDDDVRDIGKIMKEVPEDVLKECEQEIKDALFSRAWPHIRRGLTKGLPEWYKEQLVKLQFERSDRPKMSDLEPLVSEEQRAAMLAAGAEIK